MGSISCRLARISFDKPYFLGVKMVPAVLQEIGFVMTILIALIVQMKEPQVAVLTTQASGTEPALACLTTSSLRATCAMGCLLVQTLLTSWSVNVVVLVISLMCSPVKTAGSVSMKHLFVMAQ